MYFDNQNPNLFTYKRCKIHSLNIEFFHKTQSDYDDTAKFLATRFDYARKIPLTQQMHCGILGVQIKVITRRYSESRIENTHKIIK